MARWPGSIPAGVTTPAFATALDLLPTFVELAGGRLPAGRVIDGVTLVPVLLNGDRGRQPLLYYYFNEEVWAVRKGPWKIHRKTVAPAQTATWGNWPVTEHNPPLLFNLETDPGEKYNVAPDHLEIVAELQMLIDRQLASARIPVTRKIAGSWRLLPAAGRTVLGCF